MRGCRAVGSRAQGVGRGMLVVFDSWQKICPEVPNEVFDPGLVRFRPWAPAFAFSFPRPWLWCSMQGVRAPAQTYDGGAKGVKIVLKRLLCGPRAGLAFVLGKKARFLLRSNSGWKEEEQEGKKNTTQHNTYDLFVRVCVYLFVCINVFIFLIWVFAIAQKV